MLSLLKGLLDMPTADTYQTLWINPRAPHLPVPPGPRHEPRVTKVPGRVLREVWRRVGWPSAERLAGPCDVFHATQLEFPPSRRVPLVWTVHGLAYMTEPERLDPRFVAAAQTWHGLAVERCDWFIAVSDTTRAELLAAHPRLADRCVTIPLGVGEEFQPQGSRPDDLGTYLLYVGAVARHKNVQGLLDAYAIVRRRHPDLRLVLAGPVDDAFWRTVTPPDGVVLTGPLDQDGPRLPALYRGARAFVFPSFYEGWASPPLEAMASGTPVIVSNASSLPETTGDAALQVDPHDTDGLAEAIAQVLGDEDLRSGLIARGLARAATFSWARVAAETHALYQRAAAS